VHSERSKAGLLAIEKGEKQVSGSSIDGVSLPSRQIFYAKTTEYRGITDTYDAHESGGPSMVRKLHDVSVRKRTRASDPVSEATRDDRIRTRPKFWLRLC